MVLKILGSGGSGNLINKIMKIKTIKIKNFKNIKEIEINCNEVINAFIGKNDTGKSAVFDAINIVFGEIYPTANTFQKDYFNDDEKEVIIEIEFYEPYYNSYTLSLIHI